MNLRSTLATTTLAVSGVGMMWLAGGQLQEKERFDFRPNPLGLKTSPYGQVIAMAIQAPIDEDWHGGIEIHNMPVEDDGHSDHDDHVCEHDHPEDSHDHSACAHAHDDHAAEPVAEHSESTCSDPGCGHDHGATPPQDLLGRLSLAVSKRTNPNPPTEGHRLYLRREIEKKMHFAYELDPSHYGNYNTYHLFLTQAQLGTTENSRDLTRSHAVKLADATIRYCLRESSDPRPALTAASAAYNILEAMFLNPGAHTSEEMRQQLSNMDFCLRKHFELLEETSASGNWNRLSEARQNEILDRSRFTLKLREAAEKIIIRLESESRSTVKLDPS